MVRYGVLLVCWYLSPTHPRPNVYPSTSPILPVLGRSLLCRCCLVIFGLIHFQGRRGTGGLQRILVMGTLSFGIGNLDLSWSRLGSLELPGPRSHTYGFDPKAVAVVRTRLTVTVDAQCLLVVATFRTCLESNPRRDQVLEPFFTPQPRNLQNILKAYPIPLGKCFRTNEFNGDPGNIPGVAPTAQDISWNPPEHSVKVASGRDPKTFIGEQPPSLFLRVSRC